jgi:uracil-DNA glycosylase family 4
VSDIGDHVAKWHHCTACPLHKQRHRIVLGRGTVPCDVLFIGEAPGESEDTEGKPFWGKSGGLLDDILRRVIPRYDPLTNAGVPTWAMTNLVACYPREAKTTGDGQPDHEEIMTCRERLVDFINVCQPRLVVTVGTLATAYLNFTRSVQTIDIDHPAYILRMPRAQKNMATQKCIVVLRNALEDMLRSERKPFTKLRSEPRAYVEKRAREDEIPF